MDVEQSINDGAQFDEDHSFKSIEDEDEEIIIALCGNEFTPKRGFYHSYLLHKDESGLFRSKLII